MNGRRTMLVASLLILLVASFAGVTHRPVLAQTSGWVSKARMPLARAAGVAVTGRDGRIYVFGGSDGTTNFATADVYTPSQDGWAPIAALPVPLSFMGGALGEDGKIYLIGGWDGASSRNYVIAYDPASNSYACSFAGPGCTTTSLAPMPTARSNLGVAAGTDGLIYAVGGFTTQPVATVEAYDSAANMWHEVTPLPHATAGPGVSANPDGSLVVSGGFDGQSYLNTVTIGHRSATTGRSSHVQPLRRPAQTGAEGVVVLWLVIELQRLEAEHQNKKDAATVTMLTFAVGWLAVLSEASNPPPAAPFAARNLAAAGTAGNSGYVTVDLALGGASGGAASNSVIIIDPAGGKAYVGNPMPTARTRAMAAVGLDGTIYVMGGDNGNPLHPYASVDAWVPPPAPPSPTATSIPSASPTPAATPSSTPTPTATPAPPTVTLRLASKKVRAGKKQTLTVRTVPGSAVRITVAFPGGRKLHHSGTADSTGTLVWRFKEPKLPSGVKTHTVKLTVVVTDSRGRTAIAAVHYTAS